MSNPLVEYGINPVVLQAITNELIHQDEKWGKDKEQSLPGFLLVLQNELDEAKAGWTHDSEGRDSCLWELVQVIAVALRAVNRYGTLGCAQSRNDYPTHD